jgi:hypothetical protein
LLTLPPLLLLLHLGGMETLLAGPVLGVSLLRTLLGSLLALLLLLLPRLLVHLLRLMVHWRVPLWAIPERARLVQRWWKPLPHPRLLVQLLHDADLLVA